MTVLIVGEHDNNTLSPGTLSSVTAAQKLGDEVHLLVAGDDCRAAAEQAAVIDGVTRVLHGDNPANAHGIAENLAPLIAGLAEGYSHILAPASFFGKNVMPRVAAMLDVQPISDIMGVEDENTFQRPIYAGNAIATVQSADTLKILTVRSTAFDAAEQVSEAAQIVEIESPGDQGLTNFVSENLTQSDRAELTTAGRIISGGRGVGSAAAFQTLEKVADKIGAAIGASRAAVDAGFVPNDYQVGQTGKIVAPNLYVAVGISGAIQHLAGMKDSKMIVAINNDEDAPIFQVADYGLVMDWSEAMEELEAKL